MKYYLIVVGLFFSLSLSAQQQLVYKSKNLLQPDTTWVFTPTGLTSADKLPLIFLLNGYSGNHKQWDGIMNAQKYADEYGFIIVCPDGFNSWYLNSPAKGAQFETFFYDELWPDIMQKFKPAADKIFISGLSMGGHGALTLFLKHTDLYRSAGSTSGVADIGGVTTKYGLPDLMGKPAADDNAWAAFSVMGNISKLQGTNKTIIFDCGADDPFYKMNNALKAKCDELKINATYISQPGAHNKTYWAKTIRQQFNFFKAQLH